MHTVTNFNTVSKQFYSSPKNQVRLSESIEKNSFKAGEWGTSKQWERRGRKVIQGQKGTMLSVFIPDRITYGTDLYRSWCVFNLEQTVKIPKQDKKILPS